MFDTIGNCHGLGDHSVIFFGVEDSQESRDYGNPSYYNKMETTTVVTILEKLYNQGLCTRDIGIIAPYRKQVSNFPRTGFPEISIQTWSEWEVV